MKKEQSRINIEKPQIKQRKKGNGKLELLERGTLGHS